MKDHTRHDGFLAIESNTTRTMLPNINMIQIVKISYSQ